MIYAMNNDFNSALALFQSLFRSHGGDIYTVIERFILAGVTSQHLSTFTVSKVGEILSSQFNINIPNTIIQRCINNQKLFQYKRGEYFVINAPEDEIKELLSDLARIDEQNDTIVSGLFEEIEHRHLVTLNDAERNEIRQVFFDFVKDREKDSSFKYFIDIYKYIVKNEKDENFQKALDAIKEGMIIYHGIRYSETSDHKTWKHDTTFFLDMEYLFSAYALNGSYYQECFYDFYNLVQEINEGSSMRSGKPRISLRYFSKTRENIDRFFAVAARIKKGEESISDDNEAMSRILNGSADELGVLEYKTCLFKKLNDLGITEYTDEIDLETGKQYLFETAELSNKISSEFAEDEQEDVSEYLLFADYINILRGGKQASHLDRCGYIFLSESKLSTRFSKFLSDNDGDAKTFVIARMSRFTEDMWFRLRKGIVSQDSIATLKVISKAKSIVSGLLSDSITTNYKKIKEAGKDPEEMKMLYAELRGKRHTPENVTADTIDSDVSFIVDDDFISNYRETQSHLRIKAEKADAAELQLQQRNYENATLRDENKSLRDELRQRDYQALCEKRQRVKRKFCFENFIYTNAKTLLWLFVVVLLITSICLETANPLSPLGILSSVVTVVAFVLQLSMDIERKALRFRDKRYRCYLESE